MEHTSELSVQCRFDICKHHNEVLSSGLRVEDSFAVLPQIIYGHRTKTTLNHRTYKHRTLPLVQKHLSRYHQHLFQRTSLMVDHIIHAKINRSQDHHAEALVANA